MGRSRSKKRSDFRNSSAGLERKETMSKTVKQLAEELLSKLGEGDSTDVKAVATRRDYWRQRCGEARGLVRDTHKEIKSAISILQKLDTAYAAQRKTWIGPKVPPKVVQKPHRSRDGE